MEVDTGRNYIARNTRRVSIAIFHKTVQIPLCGHPIRSPMRKLTARPDHFTGIGILALIPWTIDFDQHFALYVANLAKAGLVTGAFLFVLARVGRILRWR